MLVLLYPEGMETCTYQFIGNDLTMSENESPIVGIDLGTTNSVVAIVIDGQPQVLDCDGQPSLPSIVGLTTDEKLITGVVARNQLAAFPDRTIASIKRKMGTMEPVALGDQEYTPPEISAMILRRLRDVASRATGKDISRAVITVPAYFDENQRQATRQAGTLAGLTVERIINEPTAATLVYHADSPDRKHIAVYDFGGGTFDVSVVRMEAGVTEVLSSQGDTHLGGDDLDSALLDYVAEKFMAEHDIDLRENLQSRYRVQHACEQAKIHLSQFESTTIAEEFVIDKDGRSLNLNMEINRETFNDLIEPFIERTIDCVNQAIQDASMTMHQIDDLVLVGGSTRIPLVADRLREQFLREPSRAVDPDLAVALGAAVQAAMLEGQNVGPVLVDVSTHTLGIEACGEITFNGPELMFVPIIRRHSPLPARYEKTFSKMFDEQESVKIHVMQGDSCVPEDNTSIGSFDLNVKSMKSTSRKIVVGFDLTLDGVLRVTAKQPGTGRTEELVIQNAFSDFTANDQERVQSRLTEMFDESDEISNQDVGELPIPIGGRNRVHSSHESNGVLLPKAQDRFPKTATLLVRAGEMKAKLQGEDAEELETLSQRLSVAMEAEDESTVEELTADLDDLLFYVQ